MPRIRVEWLQGRTEEMRRELVRRFTDSMVDVVGLRPDQVTVIFEEISPALQYKGGEPWTELLKKK